MTDRESDFHKEEGPILLLAGPGTGKTHQLALRIKFLVEEQKIPPEQITVISFTASAAVNMRARISDPTHPELFVELNRQPKRISTMHSLGLSIIRENAKLLSLSESLSLVHSDAARSVLLGDAAQLAGCGRNDAEAVAICRQNGDCTRDGSEKCAICDTYRKILNACNAIDYDDQILLACRVLRENSDLAAKYRTQSAHLLVDEYQDINGGQFELINGLSHGQVQGLFVVGDDDQSIYSWRGGSPEFIRNFEQHFGSHAKVSALRTSRRCHRNILEGAIAVVKANDKGRRDKGKIAYANPDGPLIHIHSVPSEKGEAAVVCQVIADALPSREVLVLVPTKRHGALIAKRLRQARIPYVAPEPLPGAGLPLLERLAAWLRNENDNLALRECIESIVNNSRSPVPSNLVRKAEKKAEREEQYKQVSALWRKVLAENQSLWEVLASASDSDEGLVPWIRRQCNRVRLRYRQGNIAGLLWRAARSLEPWRETRALIEEVETWVNRFSESPAAASGAQVRIMTLQGAKGLEADVVCVVGLEQDTMPRNGAEGEELSEYSRLMYVSMTRAKSELHLFHARTRSGAVSFQQLHGKCGPHTLTPSCFLGAIPANCRQDTYHRAKQ